MWSASQHILQDYFFLKFCLANLVKEFNMMFDKANYIEFFFLLILAVLWTPGGAHDCSYTGWDYDDNPCPDGYNEIYREVAASVQQSQRLCCLAGSKGETSLKRDAPNCRATKCLSSSSSEICSTLYDRYIDDSKLEYEEVMREPCTRPQGQGQGVVALCCQPNSTESLLVSTLGAEENEFPHQAKLKLPGDCGGTIYNKRFIITASHCIVEDDGSVTDASGMKVILGTNIADVDTEDYVYKVTRAIPHEKYSKLEGQPELPKGDDGLIYNDIALLELDRDIQFAHNIKALEIAPKGFQPLKYSNKSVIVGWGTTDTLALAIHLQKANFEIRSDRSCFAKHTGRWNDMDGYEKQLLCVGGVMEGKWSYTAGGGDSGGPAICRGPDEKIRLCGVTSYGGSDEKCAASSVEANCPPSVYAEVAFFHDWINEHAGPQDPKTFYQPYLYGKKVDRAQYPHQVHVTSQTGKPCGGTLVAPDVVVTAGQCVNKGDGSQKTYPGLKVTTANGKTFDVKAVAQLPGFKREGQPVNVTRQKDRVVMTDNFYKNDLAVLKLEGKTSVNPKKLPALPTFGETYYQAEEISLSRSKSGPSQLMTREYKLLDAQVCQARMDRMAKAKLNVKVDKNVLCGVELFSGGSTCERELGGGLLCLGKNGKDVLCGVQTFRLCEFSIPNGFINMALYSNWVRDAIKTL